MDLCLPPSPLKCCWRSTSPTPSWQVVVIQHILQDLAHRLSPGEGRHDPATTPGQVDTIRNRLPPQMLARHPYGATRVPLRRMASLEA